VWETGAAIVPINFKIEPMKKFKTYAESKRRKPFDWNKFLSKKNISDRQWDKAEQLAANWVTCACGGQCDVIPRYPRGAPIDNRLCNLGFDFYCYISSNDIDGAKETLMAIEKRSEYLIKKIRAKKHN
jgi:hypothetical protein